MADNTESTEAGTQTSKPATTVTTPPATVDTATIVAKERELAAAQARLAEIERREKERAENEKKRASMDAQAAKEALAAKEREAQELADRIRTYEEASVSRTMGKLDALDDSNKERILKYKEKMKLDDWMLFVDEETARIGAPVIRPNAPPAGTPSDGANMDTNGLPISEKAKEILGQMYRRPGVDVKKMLTKNSELDEATHTRVDKFRMHIQDFFNSMLLNKPKNLNYSDADKRR